MVQQTFFLEGVGLVLAPGLPRERALEAGTPLFLVRPDGIHLTASVLPLAPRAAKSLTQPVAVGLGRDEVTAGTRVFGKR